MAVPYTFGSATTSIPLSQLDSNFATTITLGNTAVQLGNTITNLTGVSNVASATSLSLGSNGNTTAITVDTSQNVGIGTTSPANKLDVNGTTRISNTAGYANFTMTGNANNGGVISFIDSASVTTSRILGFGSTAGSPDNSALRFDTNGSERMRLDSSGNLLVGTTTQLQSAKLTVNGAVTTNTAGADGGYNASFITQYTGNTVESNAILASVGSNTGFRFDVSNGGGSSGRTTSFYINKTSCQVVGSLSKGSGSFRIDHPLAEKTATHELVHSFIEGPQADLIYRGKVNLVNGTATVNIDTASTMTDGTFVALCRDVQCFTTNESDWTAVRGSVSGNLLTIEAQDNTSTASISWMVIGERKDKHMMETAWTDETGKVIVEPLKNQETSKEEVTQ